MPVPATDPDDEIPLRPNDWRTIPNLITGLRVIGSPLLIVLAWWGQLAGLGVLLAGLVLTEWLDGFLARRWRLETATGARLDTVADAVFYSSILIAFACLNWQQLVAESGWIGIAIISYLASWLTSWVRFGKLPSYHTWMAKGAWVIVIPGIVLLVLGWDPIVFRIAMVFVVVTNLEAIGITLILNQPRVDVRSIWKLRTTERK